MMKRNKALVAFIVVAVLVASIGFAAIVDTLEVGGNITLDYADNGSLDQEFSENIHFAAGSNYSCTVSGVDQVTIGAITTDAAGDKDDRLPVTINATAFTKIGDVVTVNAQVQNENTCKAKVTGEWTSTQYKDSECIEVSVTDTTIDAKSTGVVVITFTLKKLPVTAENTYEGTYEITLNAVPAE